MQKALLAERTGMGLHKLQYNTQDILGERHRKDLWAQQRPPHNKQYVQELLTLQQELDNFWSPLHSVFCQRF